MHHLYINVKHAKSTKLVFCLYKQSSMHETIVQPDEP